MSVETQLLVQALLHSDTAYAICTHAVCAQHFHNIYVAGYMFQGEDFVGLQPCRRGEKGRLCDLKGTVLAIQIAWPQSLLMPASPVF